jgi:puromycin-sensitive aminopeptidase
MPHPTEDRNFRLPTGIRPTAYRAWLSVDLKSRAFSGIERIELRLDAPTDEIALHAADLDVRLARCHLGSRSLLASSIGVAAASETVLLRFPERLPEGTATLELAWGGRMSPGLRGLYFAGQNVAITQFEAADARRLFPCFDEPGFKATWQLTVDAPAGIQVLSNSKPLAQGRAWPGRQKVEFSKTPKLPTYLVALALGDLQAPKAGAVRGVPVRTFAVPAKQALIPFGQQAALEALPRLWDYFGVPYAFGKLDQVGVPDFEAGAMENAGLVTYREVALLLDPAIASLAQKKRVAEVVTHELAHQWFGNWVTMQWWDDLWLNEAFATWMAYKVVDRWQPKWRVWLDFDQGKAAAMHLDALRSTHPIRAEVRNAAEAGESFDLITYEKGGAVLRMIEGYLGEDRFRAGIRQYMKRHAQANAVADDLWSALAVASKEPVVELANAWIRQPGFPVVRVAVEGRKVRLTQKRFFSDPGATWEPGTWPVPMVLRYGAGKGVKERRVLLEGVSDEVTLEAEPRWLCANAGSTGFYRVEYDSSALARLRENLSALSPSERIGLLNDQWSLVRSGAAEIGAFLDLASAFGGEEDYAVLAELVGRLGAIEYRLVSEADRPRFRAFVARLFAPQLRATGWDASAKEEDAVRLRRAAAVRALGGIAREAETVREALARLERWLSGDRAALEANLNDAAVEMAARAGDASAFERFQKLFASEKDPAFRRRYLHALAAFEAPELWRRAARMSFTDEVPLQDAASFAGALLANSASREAYWGQLRGNWEALLGRLKGAPMLLRRIVEALGSLVTRQQLEEATAFLAAHPLEEAKQATAQTLERLRQDVALRERTQPAIGAWLSK